MDAAPFFQLVSCRHELVDMATEVSSQKRRTVQKVIVSAQERMSPTEKFPKCMTLL